MSGTVSSKVHVNQLNICKINLGKISLPWSSLGPGEPGSPGLPGAPGSPSFPG